MSPGPRPPPALLQVKDVAVCGDYVHPVHVVWSDKDGERSVGLGGLHKLLAQHPALRGLKEWEHGRYCSELWGPSRLYKPISSAHLGEVGWLGCEDAALGRGMGRGEGREVKEESEGQAPPPTQSPPSKPKPPPKKKRGQSPPTHKAEAV